MGRKYATNQIWLTNYEKRFVKDLVAGRPHDIQLHILKRYRANAQRRKVWGQVRRLEVLDFVELEIDRLEKTIKIDRGAG